MLFNAQVGSKTTVGLNINPEGSVKIYLRSRCRFTTATFLYEQNEFAMSASTRASSVSNFGDRKLLLQQKPKVSQSAEADRPKLHCSFLESATIAPTKIRQFLKVATALYSKERKPSNLIDRRKTF